MLAMAETAVTFSERTDWPDFRSPASTNRSDVFVFILGLDKILVGSSSLFSLRFSVQCKTVHRYHDVSVISYP